MTAHVPPTTEKKEHAIEFQTTGNIQTLRFNKLVKIGTDLPIRQWIVATMKYYDTNIQHELKFELDGIDVDDLIEFLVKERQAWRKKDTREP